MSLNAGLVWVFDGETLPFTPDRMLINAAKWSI